jgi:VanZ family protein
MRWAPALLWAAAIFFLSSRTVLVEMPSLLGWDKLQHCVAYAAGGAAIAYGLNAPAHRFAWTAALLGSLYGVSDEIHQYFVPSRSSDWRDWVADTVGVLAGVFLYRSYLAWRGRRGGRAPVLER